jgi:hypothetical protein
VQVNEIDNQIVSISADCVIKVWDMRSSRCLETIVESTGWDPTRVNIYYDSVKQVPLSMYQFMRESVCDVVHNLKHATVSCMPLLVQVLLAGGDKLEMWHKRRAREARTALIAAMVYNPLFRQVAATL